MELIYPNKKSFQEIEQSIQAIDFGEIPTPDFNYLIQGENLSVLKALIPYYSKKVDLIYIDPPFATNNVFRIGQDRISTMSHQQKDAIAYQDTLQGWEFLEFLRERLYIAKSLLSEEGSIYLHIDYKIGHYVKLIMDEVFGIENFRNDITRIKCNPKNFNRNAYGNVKDMILFYSKSSRPIWNHPIVDYTEADIQKLFKKVSPNGRRYTTVPLHAPNETKNGETSKEFKGMKPPKGRHWRCSPAELEELDEQGLIEWSKNGVPRKIIYADEKTGKKRQDIWEFKDPQYPKYPTEKNYELLKTIIKASSNKGSLVLDFFCGSGTTLLACEDLGRKWIGVDQSEKAAEAAVSKLYECKSFKFLKV
jgi:adenine-specific DNA-methyltransferase